MKIIVECKDQSLTITHPNSTIVIKDVISIKNFKEAAVENDCKKCGHTWVSRKVEPAMCPKCKTTKWRGQ
jgi:predicted Zn-ribbon and HTH transcriptional regulator